VTSKSIYVDYLQRLKPLIAELEGRMEEFEEPLLENISDMFDYICEAELVDNPKKQEENLSLAKEKLDLAVQQSYMYLSYAIWNTVILPFEKHLSKEDRESLEEGNFVGKYDSLRKNVVEIVKQSRKEKTIMSVDYSKAYEDLKQMESMILQHNQMLYTSNQKKSTLTKMWLELVISIAASYFCYWLSVKMDIFSWVQMYFQTK
jgi:hypothetical protein